MAHPATGWQVTTGTLTDGYSLRLKFSPDGERLGFLELKDERGVVTTLDGSGQLHGPHMDNPMICGCGSDSRSIWTLREGEANLALMIQYFVMNQWTLGGADPLRSVTFHTLRTLDAATAS